MKIRKRMLAGIVALTMAVTTLAGWTSQDSASAQSSSNAAADTAAVNYDLSASDITMTADLSYVMSDSEVNTVTLTLEGGTFKEGIGTDDIRLDNAFAQMTVGDVSASGNTLTLKLKGTPVKNKQVNIYEAGTIVVLASGISDAQDYVTAKVPVQTPFIGFDAKNDLINEGYSVVDYDLNSGIFGGKKIYLGYKTTDDYSEAIKDFRVIETSAKPDTDYIGETLYNLCPYTGHSAFRSGKGDLNASAGGADLVIYYTKTETADKRAVERVTFGGAWDHGMSATMHRVYDINGTDVHDLNENAGGDDIWMYQYKTRDSQGQQEYISEINTVQNSNSSTAKSWLTDRGYTVLDYDLNNRAGGSYVYLGYKTTTDKSQAITKLYLSGTKNMDGITVDGITYTAPSNSCNLNWGVSGSNNIYIYYAKNTDDEPLTTMWFNNYKTESLQEWDLNAGAGGDDIYLHYANAFDTTTTEVVPDENDPEYYPYCYTLGKKVYLLDSKTYDVYGISLDHRHYNFNDTTRDEFISRMQNSSIRDELYDAGLLRDEELFGDLKNLPLSINFSREKDNLRDYGGENWYQTVNVTAIESAAKSTVDYNPAARAGGTTADWKILSETRKQEFLMLAAVDTSYSATLPVESDYAKELGSKYEDGKLSYIMDIGGIYTTIAQSGVRFYDTSENLVGIASVKDTTPSTNRLNGDTYYELSYPVATAAQAEQLTARFYYNEQDYFDLTPYKVVSYNKTYSFYADRNLTLYAVYVDEDEQVDAVGTTEIINMYKDTENKKLIFVSYSTVPEGCRIDKAGVIATNDANVAANPDTFNVERSTFVRGDASDRISVEYTWTKSKVNVGDTWYVRAYLVYTDKNGNTHEMLGDIVSQTM